MYGTDFSVKSIEYNEYVVGYVVTFTDDRTINVQYEPNRNTNHPEPDYIAVIGAQGDETIDAFTIDEQEFIKRCVLNIEEIDNFGRMLTEIMYSDNEEAINKVKSNPLYYSTILDAFEIATEQ